MLIQLNTNNLKVIKFENNWINIKERQPEHGQLCFVRLALYWNETYKAQYSVKTFFKANQPFRGDVYKSDSFIEKHIGAKAIDVNKLEKSELLNKQGGTSFRNLVFNSLKEWESIIIPKEYEKFHLYWKPVE